MLIRSHIMISIPWSIHEGNNDKELMKAIDEQFKSSDKGLIAP